MHNHMVVIAILAPLILMLLGCRDTNVPSDSAGSATLSDADVDGNTEGVVKIAVLTDGTVFVNSKIVPIETFGSKLDAFGDIKEIWYHREAPDAAEPHENAMKALAEIAKRKLPIAMYLDRDFTQRANFDE